MEKKTSGIVLLLIASVLLLALIILSIIGYDWATKLVAVAIIVLISLSWYDKYKTRNKE